MAELEATAPEIDEIVAGRFSVTSAARSPSIYGPGATSTRSDSSCAATSSHSSCATTTAGAPSSPTCVQTSSMT
jgi:hypothetical protein